VNSATVVGAGAFGAAIGRELAGRGFAVDVVEQYTPGNVRSASGGDTRLLRMAHGDASWYAETAWRARAQWLELQEESGARIFEAVGVAWLAHRDDGFEARSRAVLDRLGVPNDWLSVDEAARLFPSFTGDGLAGVLLEPAAGVLHARRATQLLVADAERLGARLVPGHVTPRDDPATDVVVWACGPWLGSLFPGVVDVKVSRRDVFFFGGDADWRGTPGFCDYDDAFYGHGEIEGLGVKVAPDFPGDEVDPDTLERRPSPELERAARDYIARRFPALADAPLIGGRVCQYDLSADTHFIVDRHPERASWWIVGGGSGHGFKHAPALAQYVADCIEGLREPEPFHALGVRTGDAGLRTASYG
jgi:glycine/D-amino acid oxidase-like deaminating enzyme